jgi:hypothetical protein
VVDFKVATEHFRRSDIWAKEILQNLERLHMETSQNNVNTIAKALREAYRQGKLGIRLETPK